MMKYVQKSGEIFLNGGLSKSRAGQVNSIWRRNQSIYERGKTKLFELMSVYEEAIGIKEVKQAQDSVRSAEKNFTRIQNERRQLNQELMNAQSKLRQVRDDMDRLSRTDSNYLKLFTEEHGLLKDESKLMNDYKLKEEEERAAFFNLSSRLRDAQERERIRVERTKYLQFGLSIVCASLGILSTYLLNYWRNSNIREILEYDKEHFHTLEQSVKSIMEKQEDFESSFESAMSRWNNTFKANDSGSDEALLLESNASGGELVLEDADKSTAVANQPIPNYYIAILSIALIASYVLIFKNK